MSEDDIDTTGPFPFNTILLGVIAAITAFMIWCGVSSTPLPEWVYWITTLL
jgi:hypothetical protein